MLIHYLLKNTAKCLSQQLVSRYFRVKGDDSESLLHRKCGWQIRLSSLGHRGFALHIDLPDLCLVTSLVFFSVAHFPEDWTLGNACALGWRKWLLWRTGSWLLCAYLWESEEQPASPRTSLPCSGEKSPSQAGKGFSWNWVAYESGLLNL